MNKLKKKWNRVSFSCCCSSLTFFSHKFTQRHMFPRNILPWNIPFQWKTASVRIFFFQLALTLASKGPWGSSGECSVYLLGSTACPQKMVLQIKNRQHGTQHLWWKMRRRRIFFSLALLQHNARILWEHVSALLSKTWSTRTHGLILRADISRTSTILVGLRSVS